MILLVVGAAWMAVLLPPLMRSRFDGGAVSSVSEFRRQLNTLQRTQGPRSQAPMRTMARPLVPGPRPLTRPAPSRRASAHGRPHLVPVDDTMTAAPRHRRSHHTAELSRRHFAAEQMFMSPREIVRRRRTNVLFGLVALNGLSLFLAFTTGSTAMVYLFAVAAIVLGGYCYTLVQIRNQEYLRRYYGTHRAA